MAGGRAAGQPSARQRAVIKEILWSQPSLRGGGALLLLYCRDRTAEASWLCAYARAAGLPVRLAAVAPKALVIEKRMRAEATAGLSTFVLADMALNLIPGTIQLAGTAQVSPLELWQQPSLIAAQAGAMANGLSPELVIPTGPTAKLVVGVGADGWLPDAGSELDGQARVLPAGAVQAEVARADGVFVADGAISVNRAVNTDARLAGRPVVITVAAGIVTSVECPDRDLCRFLDRAVRIHRAASVTAVRFGIHPLACGFSAVDGPVNACHQGVTLRLRVGQGLAYSTASADLRIDLTASRKGVGCGSDT